MDFDEYEYLENTVEYPEKERLEVKVNGGVRNVESEEKDLSRRLTQRNNNFDRDDSGRPSKRHRSGKDDAYREKNRGSHQSSSSRDEEIEKNKNSVDLRNRDKEEGSGKERGRYRHHERERERERDKDNDRNRNRREHARGYEEGTKGEGERETLRHSKRLSERYPGEPEKESRDRQHSTDKDNKEKHVEREFRDRDRGSRRHKEKKDEMESVADPERDQRTVFAYQISLKASERDVYDFFSRAGKVRDVQLILDRNSRRSKGFGYIEFYDVMSVPMAIALSGQPLLGQPVMVKPSEAEKNLVQSTSVASGEGGLLGSHSGGVRRLYVGNLPVTIKEDQLRQVFESFGAVELVQMPTDPGTGNCKGYAFIQFTRLEDANAAQNLNGQLEIAGRVIKVDAVTDQAGVQKIEANITDFDDDDGSGLSLNSQSRAILMRKLDRTGTASSPDLSLPLASLGPSSAHEPPGLAAAVLSIPAGTGPSIDAIGEVPSQCLLLKNMFDTNSEAETDFDLDVKEDVQDECSKFGRLKHIYVDKNSAGCVYLRFETTQSSTAAQRSLHGRWFAGKMITASFMVCGDYDAKFPDSGR